MEWRCGAIDAHRAIGGLSPPFKNERANVNGMGQRPEGDGGDGRLGGQGMDQYKKSLNKVANSGM